MTAHDDAMLDDLSDAETFHGGDLDAAIGRHPANVVTESMGPAPSGEGDHEATVRPPDSVPSSGAVPGTRHPVDGVGGRCPAVLDGVRCWQSAGHEGYHFRKVEARG